MTNTFYRKASKAYLVILLALALIGVSSCGKTPPSEEFIKNQVLKLVGPRGSCTGEQIIAPSGKKYILSAAHCLPLAQDGSIETIDEQGRHSMNRVIAEDPNSDLILLEGSPNLEGLQISDHAFRGEHLRSFTHGAGLPTYKTEGNAISMELEMIAIFAVVDEASSQKCLSMPKYVIFADPTGMRCTLYIKFLITTVSVVPGSSGGPIVNDAGEVTGVVSGGSDNGLFSLLIGVRDINNFLEGY